MKRWIPALLLLPLTLTAESPLPSFAEPGVAPDGSTIAFVSGGDIWEVPARGGEARLLVSHAANESRPLYSPEGRRLAFSSNRTGNGDVYVLTLATGELARLTYDDANEQVSGWSRDGKWVFFSSGSHDIGSMLDVYRVSADGGTPAIVAGDRYATEYFAAPGPQRQRRGGQRPGRSRRPSGGTRDIVTSTRARSWIVRHAGAGVPNYEPVTKGGAKDAWPMWSGDGKTLYFMSDRSGTENIVSIEPGKAETQPITTFKDRRVLWPSITGVGRTIAFERNFGIWTVDTRTCGCRA